MARTFMVRASKIRAMKKLLILCASMSLWLVITGCQRASQPAAEAPSQQIGFAAVAGERGGQDQTGPYEVVPDWPKPLSQLPGHEKWTWGATQGIFAETPNRVFLLQR